MKALSQNTVAFYTDGIILECRCIHSWFSEVQFINEGKCSGRCSEVWTWFLRLCDPAFCQLSRTSGAEARCSVLTSPYERYYEKKTFILIPGAILFRLIMEINKTQTDPWHQSLGDLDCVCCLLLKAS